MRFLSRGAGYALALTERGPLLSLAAPDGAAAAVLGMEFVGGRDRPALVASKRLPGRVNYLTGDDAARWHTGVSSYSAVSYRRVWRGIDVAFYGKQRQLEYDFRLRPGADPGRIGLRFGGAQRLGLDGRGNLVVRIRGGSVRWLAPRSYQRIGGVRQAVTSRYLLLPGGRVGARVGAYDHRRPLVIDPALSYATYLGGANDERGRGIAVDPSGAAYIIGETTSPDFPVSDGAAQQANRNPDKADAFVAKLNPAGSALDYATYLGGADSERAYGIAVDMSGSAYVTGVTGSTDFPTTAGSAQETASAGTGPSSFDAFVAKLDPSGSGLAYATYLGGDLNESAQAIAIDASGSAYVTGATESTNFPVTPGAPQTTNRAGPLDAYVAKIDPVGSAFAYATYLGTTATDWGYGIAVDASGSAYVTGQTGGSAIPFVGVLIGPVSGGTSNAFVTKLNPTGTALTYNTSLGGTANDYGYAIAVDQSGSAYLTGATASRDFPITPGAAQTASEGGGAGVGTGDAFVVKLSAGGSGLAYSSYLGGTGDDSGAGIGLDRDGRAYVTGHTTSVNFPATTTAAQGRFAGYRDAFMSTVNARGSGLTYSSFLGGLVEDVGFGIAVDASGAAYVTGQTNSPDFRTTPGAAQPSGKGMADGFVAKLPPTAVSGGGGTGAGPGAGGGAPTAPGTGGPQRGNRSPGSLSAGERRRASALRRCLNRARRSRSRARRRAERRGDQHRPSRARRRDRTKRRSRSARRRCLALYGRTPGRVRGLRVGARSATAIVLSFRAPGSDGFKAPAARTYLVKQSNRPIRGGRSFARARSLCGGACRFSVTNVGTEVTLTITDLRPRRTYYYAVAARDNVSHRVGPRSRTVKARTR